jgi:hypothetical protein
MNIGMSCVQGFGRAEINVQVSSSSIFKSEYDQRRPTMKKRLDMVTQNEIGKLTKDLTL